MNVVGGTYPEICFEPVWENIFGSGLRAVNLFLELNNLQEINYYTCADEEIEAHLDYYAKLYPNLNIISTKVFKNPEFHYEHPLKSPTIFPRADLFREKEIILEAKGGDILVYGLLEAGIKVEGEKVVYDPQSPSNPKAFSSTGSKAQQLITIINLSEARKITGSTDISVIKDYFFEKEQCYALILKMGPQGAMLFESKMQKPTQIPVFKTKKIWPIGSGDVYSAFFALNWFNGGNLKRSAILASKASAIYCNSKSLALSDQLNTFKFKKLVIHKPPTGMIYLAGPFFTFSERWLINEAWNSLKALGLNIFSPFHDVGHGKASDVVKKDLFGLDKSELIFAVVDGLDAGTLFEVGYAISKNKKVVVFVQNENEESLKMLEGTDCIIERDFTTAIYKAYWELASK